MAAINAGVVPSRRNIEQLLPTPINLRDKTYNELWKSLVYPNNTTVQNKLNNGNKNLPREIFGEP